MVESSGDETDRSCAPPRNKKAKVTGKGKKRQQKFRSDWKQNTSSFGNEVSLWLDSAPSSKFKAMCKWCKSTFSANTTTIQKHSESAKHAVETAKRKSTPSVAKYATGTPDEKALKQKEAVKRAEIKLAACFSAHNIPMRFVDHLIPALQDSFPDSSICKDMDMKRMKCTRVITNVIGAIHKENLSETLKRVKFSILTDESTHFNVKTAAVAVRFYDKDVLPHGRIATRFWDLSDVFPKGDFEAARQGANSEHLFELLLTAFEKHGIPLENLIGFASDGASVMIGAHNSVFSRLQERCPGIILMRCVCHSLHLAAKDACKFLPRACEDLARNAYSFLQHSSKRVAQFAEFQRYLQVAHHKMLLLSLTRWLCLRENVDRIIEQWEPLRLFITEARFEDNTHATEMLFQWLHDPIIKAYYLFLSWVLPKIATMNAYFQSNKVVVTSLHAKMSEGYKELLQSFMKPTYLTKTPVAECDPKQLDMYSPLSNLYLGVQVAEQLKHKSITPAQQEDFKKRCRNYMVSLCVGIKERFDFKDPLLEALPALKPKTARSFADRSFSSSILPFTDLVPRAKPSLPQTLQLLDDQWRRLPLDIDIPKDILEEEEVDVFWSRIGKLTDSEGLYRYAVLAEFILAVLSLPHSNADVERIFSKITLIRTRLRNRLITPTVEGLCLASECVKSSKQCCQSFEPTPKMLNAMASETLYGSKKKGSSTTDGQAKAGAGRDQDVVIDLDGNENEEDVDDPGYPLDTMEMQFG